MKEKIIGLVVSTLLIAGLGVALVYGVRRAGKPQENNNNNNNNNPPQNNTNPLSTTSNSIAAFCGPTDYKEACIESLNTISNNQSASPKDYLLVAFNATIEAMVEAIAKSEFVAKGANDSLNRMAFEDCKEFFQYGIDELNAAFHDIVTTKLDVMNSRVIDLQNWLSATVAYQESCIDGINQVELKYQMLNGMLHASQLTSNLLAIVGGIIPILNSFGVQNNTHINSRKLLDIGHVGKDGFPTWILAENRKLLHRVAGPSNAPKPHATVAQDGSGEFKTIGEALAMYPKNMKDKFVIYVKKGVYNEQVIVPKDHINVFMYGDGPLETVVTGSKNNRDGVTTYQSATFAAIGNGFICKSMGFKNTAGPEGHQAVALRVQSDTSVFYNCRMEGYQDTLYAQTHRQFYRNCVISGTVDFIFGDAAVVIQNSIITVRKPLDKQQNTVTAQGKQDKRETTGIVIHNCTVVPEQQLFPLRFEIPTFLGRPWKQYSTAVIMKTQLGDLIQPSGWFPWSGDFALDTLCFAEYENQGPGANTSKRVHWKGYHIFMNDDQALPYTVDAFIQGKQWLPPTDIPYIPGLKN